MPAPITPVLPDSAVAAAKFVTDLKGGSATAQEDISANGAQPFAAIIQQMMGQKWEGGADGKLLPSIIESISEGDDKSPTQDLNALLPFFEALGLMKFSQEDASKENIVPDSSAESGYIPVHGLPLVVAQGGTDTAISTSATTTIAATVSTATTGESPAEAATQFSTLLSGGNTDDTQNVSTTMSSAGQIKEGEGSSAGHDFAKQLVTAVEGSKEAPREPGSTAAAVHQVISSASPRQATEHPVREAVGSASWNERIGDRVVWMANNKESHAELVLTPPQMGRVEVKLSISDDQATATFVSANPQVREALEAALPRLREILADAGVQLGQAQVGAENAGQSAQQEKNGDNFAFGRDSTSTGEFAQPGGSGPTASAGLKSGRGLVDVFA